MNKLLIISVGLVLTGCVAHNLESMRERTPVISADSAKTTQAIGTCLAAATDRLGIVSYLPSPNGATLAVQVGDMYGRKSITAGADIEDFGSRRHVTAWIFKTVWSKHNRHVIEGLRGCL